jgi:nucleoside-diphosphate-sugar epimerase
VYVSTVKAMGEETIGEYDERNGALPVTTYGKAKRAAEELVLAANSDSMQTCVLRIPPVYGRGAKGNLSKMVAATASGWFPPLPDNTGKRSWVHVNDVAQAVMLVASHPSAAGQLYLVTDGEPLSSSEIHTLILDELGLPPRRWEIPWWSFRLAARIGDIIGRVTGRRMPLDSAVLQKITAPANYSSAKIARELGYQPKHTLRMSLHELLANAKFDA